ncbi:zinc finger CONSTANS-LIKE 4-like [Olea europaea subsp. europaea]|uniref:Zinc finger CONSTANS-LIKE 4-like n=1 Tax=Olea europaea subsp. europaea TaxID=158383 RepID=A0A8S0RTN5_OLEEU|nr:zinc finger CONSTANS-LIKE 4-like [Olea europaea subsp. europaea]
MSKKGCELCSNPARMFCESDQASLCWDCDEKVHGANFLVAKHTRSLLCHVCQSPTPWKAAGTKLGPTVSICHTCAENQVTTQRGEDGDSQESETDDGEYYSDSDDYVDAEEEEEEDGENQVVPWSNSSYTPPSPHPPPLHVASSSSSDADNISFTSLKRMRDCPFDSEDEDACCSLEYKFTASNLSSGHCFQESEIVGSSTSSLFRPLKLQRAGEEAPIESRTAAIVASLRKFQREIVSGEEDASAIILGISKLTRDS